jgi:hypothetical protein
MSLGENYEKVEEKREENVKEKGREEKEKCKMRSKR